MRESQEYSFVCSLIAPKTETKKGKRSAFLSVLIGSKVLKPLFIV